MVPPRRWIPDAAHEAMRDLVRARATAVRALSKARQRLQGFLLRHDRIYHGARAWTLPHRDGASSEEEAPMTKIDNAHDSKSHAELFSRPCLTSSFGLNRKKTKDPRAMKRSKGPSVIASTTWLLSWSGVGGRGMGKPLQLAFGQTLSY
jgi:transposase